MNSIEDPTQRDPHTPGVLTRMDAICDMVDTHVMVGAAALIRAAYIQQKPSALMRITDNNKIIAAALFA